MRYICTSIVATLVLAGTSFADTITVCQSGCDYSDITSALEHASNGDVIEIDPNGDHPPEGYMPFTIDNQLTITIEGNGATIRGMEGMGSAVIIEGGVTATIKDLVITNNNTCPPPDDVSDCQGVCSDGGGMLIEGGTVVTITGCTITDNNTMFNSVCGGEGGGIFIEGGATVTITDCTISDNTALNNGGGIYCESSQGVTITGCTISGNAPNGVVGATASLLGNGGDQPLIHLENSTICGNGDEDSSSQLIGSFHHVGNNSINDVCPGSCNGDTDSNGVVDIEDLLNVIGTWGPCP